MAKTSTKSCSFCGRPESQVDFLILGLDNNARICNECVDQAADIVKENLLALATKKASKIESEKTPKPREIKKFLDQYVIGQDDAKKLLSVSVHKIAEASKYEFREPGLR